MIRRFTRHALEAFKFPVVAVDRYGFVVSVNQAVGSETGLTPRAAVGQHFSDVFYHGRLLDNRYQFLSPLMDTLVREKEIINHKLIIKTDLHPEPIHHLVTTWIMRNCDRQVDMTWGFYFPPDLPQELQLRNMRMIHSFSAAIGQRDPYTRGHLERVAIYSLAIGQTLDLSPDNLNHLFFAAMTHDIGKIGLPPELLNKPGRLNADEMAVIRQHPQFSANVLKHFEMPPEIVQAVLCHHERYDGKGYPKGLAGESIPLLGRILAVADSFEAMTSARVYRPGFSNRMALEELARHAGTQFDPLVVQKTLELAVIMNLRACRGHDECISNQTCSHCIA
ncbi:MAG TPA: HD domain-containing phosphohydrolase [Spirochaetia bacterium]|nr:HD domain-containing phosphohydrolase [Spirochaetia bacterium]